MDEALLQTKLYAPVTRSRLVERGNLLSRLNSGLSGRLTLVSAPAGFGKTTIIAAWGQQLATESPYDVAWFALDENDNDATRFFTYFISAIQTADHRIGQAALTLLREKGIDGQSGFLTELLNDLAQTAHPIVLVLDDYHLIHHHAIHTGINFLLTHTPPTFHLVLITRADPPFSLVKMRARHQITEIRQRDLRFSRSEIDLFLNRLMALELAEPAVKTVERRTEGWIAGIQLAALSLQGSADREQMLRDFTGSHRYIFDYLLEEVLGQISAASRNFLLKTAILERFCAPLCDAVLAATDSQQVLEALETANLFLVPLDGTRDWYRYHHLFADLLRNILQRELPSAEASLHSRASHWFEQAGFREEAVEHALSAKELKRAAVLMEPLTHRMAYRMENERLGRWVNALPDALLIEHPGIVFPYAVTLSATNQLDAYSAYLTKTEETAHAHIDKPAAKLILGQVEILKSISFHIRGEYEAALHAVQEAEERLRQYKLPAKRWELISIRGYALNHVHGAAEAALDELKKAIRLGEADEGSVGATLCHTFTANCYMQQGRLREAERHLQIAAEAAQQNGQRQLHAIFPATLQARIRYERNALEGLDTLIEQYLPFSRVAGFTMDPVDSLFVYVMQPLADGRPEKAEQHMENGHRYFHTLPLSTGFTERLSAIQALLWLRTGAKEQAMRWAARRSEMDKIGWRPMDAFPDLVKARILSAQHRFEAATDLLTRLNAWARREKLSGIVLETLILQAANAAAGNRLSAGAQFLESALNNRGSRRGTNGSF